MLMMMTVVVVVVAMVVLMTMMMVMTVAVLMISVCLVNGKLVETSMGCVGVSKETVVNPAVS